METVVNVTKMLLTTKKYVAKMKKEKEDMVRRQFQLEYEINSLFFIPKRIKSISLEE